MIRKLKRAADPCVSGTVVDTNGDGGGAAGDKVRELGRPSTWRYREVASGVLACTSSGKPPTWLQ